MGRRITKPRILNRKDIRNTMSNAIGHFNVRAEDIVTMANAVFLLYKKHGKQFDRERFIALLGESVTMQYFPEDTASELIIGKCCERSFKKLFGAT